MKSDTLKRSVIVTCLVMLNFSPFQTASALTSRLIITDGGTSDLRQSVSKRLTSVVNGLGNGGYSSLENSFTAEGLASLSDLILKTHIRNVNPLYEVKLLDLPGRGFEVRGIKVHVDLQGTPGNPYQQLVFTLDETGLIEGVRFGLENQHYREIVRQGEQLRDMLYRQQILQFLEIFRTAYNRKDLEYLEQVYSDDALIIVGRVVRPSPEQVDYLESSSLSRERIQFIRLSKEQYTNRLEKCFQANEFIKVNFAEVEVRKHPKKDLIYGVTLKQNWHSSSYSDEGYLFLMVDFRDRDNPLIHVRSWQPERFPDGSVVSLGDFELIE